MNALLLALTTLSAQAATGPLSGTCHANILNDQGSIVRQSDIVLTQVDPGQHYGLALKGEIENTRVNVSLDVARFDDIGRGKNDQIIMTIANDNAAATSLISGRALIQGDKVKGDLISSRLEVDCTAGI